MNSLVVIVSLAGFSALLRSQSSESDISAQDLAREVVQHEIKASGEDHSHWSYHKTTEKAGKAEERLVVETQSGDLDRLVSVNGKPLSGNDQAKEQKRIQDLLRDPSRQRRRQEDNKKDAQKMDQMLKLLPEAWLFRYGTRQGSRVQLLFRPNPNFHPHSRETHVLNTLAGEMWVNDKEDRIEGISGHLIHSVRFGGGVAGHLDSGQFQVHNVQVAPGIWQIAALRIHINGKALFFKTISIQQTETRSQYHRVNDDMTLAQAAKMVSRPQSVARTQNPK